MKLLTTQPDITVVGEAADSWEAVIESRKLNPDLILIEACMSKGNDLDAFRKIRENTPTTKFLVLTEYEEEDELWQAFRNGAHGYLGKNSTPEQLYRAIRDVMSGEVAISPSLSGKILREILSWRGEEGGRRDTQAKLTPKEREVLKLLSTGASDNEISSQLYIAASTVRHHVHNILQKLQLKNRVQLAMFSRNQKLQIHSNTEGKK